MTDNDIPDAEELSIPSSVDDQLDEYVEKNKLRALVELWRGMAESRRTPQHNSVTLRWCADELEVLIEE